MTEEVTVSSRVSELQTTSGERSFALESEALKNIANNGRMLFNFAALVPGAVPQGTGGAELGSVSGFTVNGQRPNSNNVTIDGVANIDTGDNGGNMATTNIDSVAEFKVLTNSYQAEYGRAVGGQVQVVTKSGTQRLPRLGLLVRPALGLERQHLDEQPQRAEDAEAEDVARRPRLHHRRSGLHARRRSTPTSKKLFFFFSQEFQTPQQPAHERQTRVPTALERQGDFSQSVDSSGNPVPYIRDYQLAACRADAGGLQRGCFQDGGVLGTGSRRTASTSPAWPP